MHHLKYIRNFSIIIFLFCSQILSAQWSTDGAVNTPVVTSNYDQKWSDLTIDSDGNVFTVWMDDRAGTGYYKIYAQCFDRDGFPKWTTNGISISSGTDYKSYPRLVSDDSAGVIIVWSDNRNGNTDIYAQRILPDGTAAWATNGIEVCTNTSYQYTPQLVKDGYGGSIIIWKDQRAGKYQIYMQRLNRSGAAQWTTNGLLLFSEYNSQYIADLGNPEYTTNIISDGNHGAIIMWKGYYYKYSAYAQKIDEDGNSKWNSGNPVKIYETGSFDVSYPSISAGENGESFVSFYLQAADYSTDIYIQKLDSNGSLVWGAEKAVCKAPYNQIKPLCVSDKNGGAYIVWQDLRDNTSYNIFANHVDGNGNMLWGTDVTSTPDGIADGIAINDESGSGGMPFPNVDSDGNLIVGFYYDYTDIKIQKLSSDGAEIWSHNGMKISTNSRSRAFFKNEIDANNNAIVIWSENRTGSYYDIFLQSIRPDGSYGNQTLPVELSSFSAQSNNGMILLNWSTVTESNNAGWEVETRTLRQAQGDNSKTKNSHAELVEAWTKIGFIPGKGTTTKNQSYQFKVLSSEFHAPRLEFRLKQIDLDGKFTYSNILNVDITPNNFGLSQNYPNPFNPVTVISYQLQVQSDVKLVVFDLLGREVATLVNEKKEAGSYVAEFDGTHLSSGLYFYRLITPNYSEIKSMMLVK